MQDVPPRSPTGGRWRGTFGSHASLSLVGGTVSAAITIATVPYAVSKLGIAPYGLFTLLAVATAYVGVLDLGFSWTSSRYLAEALARRDDARVAAVLRASIGFYLSIGAVGAIILVALAHPLVVHVFNVPAELRGPGETSAYLFAAAFPFSMLQIYASALLRGASRFGLNSALQIAASVGSNLALVVALAAGGGLVAATAALVAGQGAVALAAVVTVRFIFPTALSVGRVERTLLVSFGRFSAAVSVANLGSQLLYIPNRLAVGALMPVAAAALFNVPLALAQRLLLVPASLASAALPRLTAAATHRDDEAFSHAFWQLVAWTVALLAPPTLLATLWAPTLLSVWISDDFGSAAWVLRLALVAILANAGASALGVAASAAGIPRVAAIATGAAGTLNVGLAFALTAAFGLNGSAAGLAISLLVLVAIMGGLWRRSGLPPVRLPRLRAPRAAAAVGTVCASGWIVLVYALRHTPTTRAELVLGVVGLIGAAYVALALAARPWKSASPLRSRTTGES